MAGVVMVADDEFNAFGFGVIDFLVGFDAAVQCDNPFIAFVIGVIDALFGNAVSFGIPVRNFFTTASTSRPRIESLAPTIPASLRNAVPCGRIRASFV